MLIVATLFSSCRAISSKGLGWEKGTANGAGWSTVLIKDKITYDLAWDDVSSIVVRKFEPEMMSRETGYIRTKWNYTWTRRGSRTKYYRVRVTIKMSEERKKIDINAQAQKKNVFGKWVNGYDTELLTTMKNDIAGVVGQ